MQITKVIERHLEGMMIPGCDKSYAVKRLKNEKKGTYYLLTAYNGANAYTKVGKSIRQSTIEEDKEALIIRKNKLKK